jgi:small subunit ribosomal protein S2
MLAAIITTHDIPFSAGRFPKWGLLTNGNIVITVGVKELLEAGVHFGHQTKRWNPKMKRFIFDARNGIHIIDLSQTATQLEDACSFLANVVSKGGKVLFVGTKKQAQEAIKESAVASGQGYVTERWLGGTLTNLKTIRRSINRLVAIEKMETDGSINKYVKKEQASIRREAARLHKNLDGLRYTEQLPDAMFVVDLKREHNAVAEARRLRIPIVAIVDTNCDPDLVDYPIAGNDDAIRSIRIVLNTVVQELVKAKSEFDAKRVRQQKTVEAAPVAPVAVAAPEPAPAPATPEALAALVTPVIEGTAPTVQ